MTRSIFDPNGGETERSGSTFGSAGAGDRSNVPRDLVDGEVLPQEAIEAQAVAAADAAGLTPAERLEVIPNTEGLLAEETQPGDVDRRADA